MAGPAMRVPAGQGQEMIEVPVYDESGQQIASRQIDEAILGGRVRPALLKQAVVTHQANRRQGTAATKGRSDVEGSTAKLYRQKGTGRARMGASRTPIRRGGGMAFAKRPRDFSLAMPKKMRRLARNSAILAKLQSNEAAIIDGLTYEEPKTKRLAAMLRALKADGGCLLVLTKEDPHVWLSGRNIPKTAIRLLGQLNAYEVLRHKKLLFTLEAFEALLADPVRPGAPAAS